MQLNAVRVHSKKIETTRTNINQNERIPCHLQKIPTPFKPTEPLTLRTRPAKASMLLMQHKPMLLVVSSCFSSTNKSCSVSPCHPYTLRFKKTVTPHLQQKGDIHRISATMLDKETRKQKRTQVIRRTVNSRPCFSRSAVDGLSNTLPTPQKQKRAPDINLTTARTPRATLLAGRTRKF